MLLNFIEVSERFFHKIKSFIDPVEIFLGNSHVGLTPFEADPLG